MGAELTGPEKAVLFLLSLDEKAAGPIVSELQPDHVRRLRETASHMRTSLVTDAMAMAIKAGHVQNNAIFHSDRGCQYTSAEMAAFAIRHHLRLSVGRTGVCWDNAVAETFFATLKNEMYYRHTFPSRARARLAVAEYIEVFYNRRRLHSTLGYRTPIEALSDYQATTTAA